MTRFRSILIIMVFVLIFGANTQAQQRFKLNELKVNKSASSAEGTWYYSLNEAAFTDPEFKRGAEFDFILQNGETATFKITRKSEYIPGYISVIAALKGSDERSMSFTYHEGRLNGLFYQPNMDVLYLKYDQMAQENAMSLNAGEEETLLACGIDDEGTWDTSALILERGTQNQRLAKSTAYLQQAAASAYSSLEDSITIDVMMVYTASAESYAASIGRLQDINGLIVYAMNNSQFVIDNSKLNIELRLVYKHKTNYDEINDGVDSGDLLRRFTQNPSNRLFNDPIYDGHMEEVHDLRNEYGADVMSLLVRVEDVGGIGWRLDNPGGEEEFAFNLNRVQNVAALDDYTLIHEIGHNMGSAHSRTQQENPSTQGGGLFQYSAGYQDEANGFHTVMAYDRTSNNVTLSEAPIFSSPDLTWQGKPTGRDNLLTPENNALSLKEVKRSVAWNRLTWVDPPSASFSTNSINIEMNREDNLTVPVDISNSGNSALVWGVGFEFVSNSVQKRSSISDREVIEPMKMEGITRRPANLSTRKHSNMRRKASTLNNVIYETSFENTEDFLTGTYAGRAEWRSINETSFAISSNSPKSGNQHMRLEYEGGDYGLFISSPFFGYMPLGSFEVIINFKISDLSEQFEMILRDGITGNMSSGIATVGGVIYAAEKGETGGVSYFSTSGNITANAYHELRILYNTVNQTVDYYLNNQLITQNGYLNGYSPGTLQFVHYNSVSGARLDIDDIQVSSGPIPYEWLSVPNMSGATSVNTSETLNLEFSTVGVSAGTYQTNLRVMTNDPMNQSARIPITLTVNDVVSTEVDEVPSQISLGQNYPNPFNPSTTISYSLDQASVVLLEVFNLQGKKVATLENGSRSAGNHIVNFSAEDLASGIYMYRLQTPVQTVTKKMVLIK